MPISHGTDGRDNMSFVSKSFLFIFMPLSICLYFLAYAAEHHGIFQKFFQRFRIKDVLLILLSMVFYAWAGILGMGITACLILLLYAAGRLVDRKRRSGRYFPVCRDSADGEECGRLYIYRIIFTLAAIVIVGSLVLFKHPQIIRRMLQLIFGQDIEKPTILVPIGISFISFSAISYLTDICRGQASSGSLLDCAAYILFFPKVISGPIVLWKDFEPQLHGRVCTGELSARGVNRIIVGLAKKSILADTFAAYLVTIESHSIDRISMVLCVILYTLQIYYDFSGYSDIALGLSQMFGFDFKENFNFPYRSASISEFWRRWHISLGTWFREYVYFPLGGSRCSKKRMALNLGIVFVLTGIWHGSGLNYLLWGLINGLFVIGEHFWMKKPGYQKTPGAVRHVCTMLIVMVCWQLFRAENMGQLKTVFGTLFGVIRPENLIYTWRYYLDSRMLTLLIVGILGATVLGSPRIIALYGRLREKPLFCAVQEVLLMGLLILSVLFIVNATYSPFIYFQY